MLKKIFKIIRKVVLSFLLLYAYNVFAVSYNMIIPINYFTLGMLFLFDIPGLLSLICIFFISWILVKEFWDVWYFRKRTKKSL